MFAKIGNFSVKYRYWVIGIWVLAALLMYFFAPSLSEVGKVNEASFLPADSDSLYARQLVKKYFPESASVSSVGLVFFREEGLNQADMEYAHQVRDWLVSGNAPFKVESVTSVFDNPQMESQLISPDKTTMIINVGLAESSFESGSAETVKALRDYVKNSREGLEVYVSGQAGVYSDLIESINKSIDLTTLVTIILLIVLLIVIYRSPVAILVPLLTIGMAFLVSRGALGLIALAGVSIWSQIDIFLVVLIFGIGTDYCLFTISRFREELTLQQTRKEAMVVAVARIGAVITASAFAVIVGLAGMYVARYEIIRTMGPVLGVAIFITLLAALTLAPAIASVFGKKLFWPLHEKLNNNSREEFKKIGFWERVADFSTGKPYIVIPVILIVMLLPLIALPGLNRSFNQLTELPAGSEAIAGFHRLEEHFNIGEMEPLVGIIKANDSEILSRPDYLAALVKLGNDIRNIDGVVKVQTVMQPDGSGEILSGLTVTGQLNMISSQIQTSISDLSGNPSSVLNGNINGSFGLLENYLNELSRSYPNVKNEPSYVSLLEQINSIERTITEYGAAILVENQLSMISDQIAQMAQVQNSSVNPEVAQKLNLIGRYLEELARAYPEVQADSGFKQASMALNGLSQALAQVGSIPSEQLPEILPAISGYMKQISSGLNGLAGLFKGTNRVLVSESLSSMYPPVDIRQQLNSLNSNLQSLAEYFNNKGGGFLLPETLMSSNDGLQALFKLFFNDNQQVARFYVVLGSYPQSDAAIKTVNAIRDAIPLSVSGTVLSDTEIVIGGSSAEIADVKAVLDRDFNVVIPVVIAAVFVVLIILLRSLVAPIYLLLTVLLSYGTTMGLVTWIFQDILGQEGISFLVPIIIFALLVALGSDYNMFLMSRVREESERNQGREAARLASVATGAVITACGIILAGTFVVLVITPIKTMVQIGAAVAIGVMIDTFLVRALLVPAIASVLKDWNWWPSKVGKK